jgi:hypothetical protein
LVEEKKNNLIQFLSYNLMLNSEKKKSKWNIWYCIRDRPFNLKGGLWFFVTFRNFFSDNTRRVRIFIFFVARSANFFFRI